MANPVFIAGCGSFFPGDPIPFSESGKLLGELHDAPPKIRRWLETTTPLMQDILSIEYLHYAIDPVSREFTEDEVSMAVKAARIALGKTGISADQIDLICYGSAHMQQMPTPSVRIQEALGIEACEEFSIHANCTSAYKALYLACELLRSGKNKNALVLSSSMSSSELRAEYYNQKLLDKESLFLRWFLCDGAGAIILTTDSVKSAGFELEVVYTESIGGHRPSLMYNCRPAYCLNPQTEYDQGLHHLRQNFRNELATSVFRDPDGTSVFFAGLKRMLSLHKVPVETIRYFQVNMPTRHIIDSIMDECETLGIPRTALFTRLDKLGYCGPPMGLVGLDMIVNHEQCRSGERIVSFVTEVSKFMQAGYSIKTL